ncbi:DNA-directed primase/polymerase protein-like [Hetaerina americana]|uniref:DNA-directed primase/polymerase protein-like n=1 Tax=Hetaerina americana TaxID=62018 RepID=UPI003A7F4A9D
MAFAFQQNSGQRLFLVAHPAIFWHYDSYRKGQVRCTYEIIPENTPCKIYFDLEYDIRVNTPRVPVKIVNSFIVIVSNYLFHYFNLRVDKSNVLILDSSTDVKFSCHLIYQCKEAIFRDNINVGRFVRQVCAGIREVISDPRVIDVNPELWRGVTHAEICELLVCGRKDGEKLFCDESVYSKNRHFRLYRSTKLGKNAPLLLSDFNVYTPVEDTSQEKLFLDSLITCIGEVPAIPLQFGCQKEVCFRGETANRKISTISEVSVSHCVLEKFVTELISPCGRIRKRTVTSTPKGQRIQFDIQDYRFCAKVGRHHRSNNIYIVLDGSRGTWYQKCHDPDCIGFQSVERQLPPEVSFIIEKEDPDLEREDVSLWECSSVSDEIFVEFGTFGDYGGVSDKGTTLGDCEKGDVPEFGIGDNDLLFAATKC